MYNIVTEKEREENKMQNNNKYQVYNIDCWGNVGLNPRIECDTIQEARQYIRKKKKEYKYDRWEIIYNGQRVE